MSLSYPLRKYLKQFVTCDCKLALKKILSHSCNFCNLFLPEFSFFFNNYNILHAIIYFPDKIMRFQLRLCKNVEKSCILCLFFEKLTDIKKKIKKKASSFLSISDGIHWLKLRSQIVDSIQRWRLSKDSQDTLNSFFPFFFYSNNFIFNFFFLSKDARP